MFLASYPTNSMLPRRILVYGEDTLIISTRGMILSRAGYEIAQTTRVSDLNPLLRGIFFDMLLIGDSVRTPQNVGVAKRLREQFPELPIVMVQDEKEERDPWSTAFVSSAPEQILSSIGAILEEHSRKPVVSEGAPQQQKAMQTAAGQ